MNQFQTINGFVPNPDIKMSSALAFPKRTFATKHELIESLLKEVANDEGRPCFVLVIHRCEAMVIERKFHRKFFSSAGPLETRAAEGHVDA